MNYRDMRKHPSERMPDSNAHGAKRNVIAPFAGLPRPFV